MILETNKDSINSTVKEKLKSIIENVTIEGIHELSNRKQVVNPLQEIDQNRQLVSQSIRKDTSVQTFNSDFNKNVFWSELKSQQLNSGRLQYRTASRLVELKNPLGPELATSTRQRISERISKHLLPDDSIIKELIKDSEFNQSDIKMYDMKPVINYEQEKYRKSSSRSRSREPYSSNTSRCTLIILIEEISKNKSQDAFLSLKNKNNLQNSKRKSSKKSRNNKQLISEHPSMANKSISSSGSIKNEFKSRHAEFKDYIRQSQRSIR